MKARRILASAAAAVMIAGGVTMAVAPSASAASYDVTVDCDADVWIGTPSAGDTLTFTLADGCTDPWNLYNLTSSTGGSNIPGYLSLDDEDQSIGCREDGNAGRWCVWGPDVVPTTLLAVNDEGGGAPLAQGVHLANLNDDNDTEFWILYGTEPSPSAGGGSAIPSWVQAYGRASMDATCEDGWNPSWQEWAVAVTGGWVCERSIPSLG